MPLGNRLSSVEGIFKSIVFSLSPLVTMAAYFLAGPVVMAVIAVVSAMVASVLIFRAPDRAEPLFSPLGAVNRIHFMNKLTDSFTVRADTGQSAACFALQFDEFSALVEHHGSIAADQVLSQAIARLRSVLRQNDLLTQLDGPRFAVLLAPKYRTNLETGLQLSSRLQDALAEPFSVDGIAIYCTASIGFALQPRLAKETAECFLDSAEVALREARRNGPSGVRAYSDQIAASMLAEQSLVVDVHNAFERGEITPWFQPQISTDTGKISGFEALARWRHPEKGMIPPSEFLPAMQDAGLLESLSETMLRGGLSALREWDRMGLSVPSVGVNFSSSELRNPKLVERVLWELDRFDLDPCRLSIEILETVIAGSNDDTIVANITKLSSLGCGIDLDDFGTGHASIAAIKRFEVDRIKIDRSFVSRIDQDQNQQSMLTAVLSMAEQLKLDTLAEGVETLSEHAMLCQLGCNHVQGFGLAKPMPFEETEDWINTHSAKIEGTRGLRQRFGS